MSVPNRPHRPYFDQECKQAQRSAQRLVRLYRKRNAKGSSNAMEAYDTWCQSLQVSRRLVRSKGQQYWRSALDSATLDPKQTWRHLDKLLGKADNGLRLSTGFSADFHQNLNDKIIAIRNRTPDAGTAGYTGVTGSSLSEFPPLLTADVIAIIWSSPNKQCKSNPLPV